MHRVTGVILFVGVAFVMFVFDRSLESQQGFNAVAAMFQEGFFARLIAWGLVAALLYHFFAGVKHLVMDCGFCEELESSRMAAKVTFGASIVTILLAGVWIW